MSEDFVERVADRVTKMERPPRGSRPPSDPELEVNIREMRRMLAELEPLVLRIAHCLYDELPPLATRVEVSAEIGQFAVEFAKGYGEILTAVDNKPSRRDLWVIAVALAVAGIITAWAAMLLTLHFLQLVG